MSGVGALALQSSTATLPQSPPPLQSSIERHLHGDVLHAAIAFIEDRRDCVALAHTCKRLSREPMAIDRHWPARLFAVTASTRKELEAASRHPTWSQARHVNVDSASFRDFMDLPTVLLRFKQLHSLVIDFDTLVESGMALFLELQGQKVHSLTTQLRSDSSTLSVRHMKTLFGAFPNLREFTFKWRSAQSRGGVGLVQSLLALVLPQTCPHLRTLVCHLQHVHGSSSAFVAEELALLAQLRQRTLARFGAPSHDSARDALKRTDSSLCLRLIVAADVSSVLTGWDGYDPAADLARLADPAIELSQMNVSAEMLSDAEPTRVEALMSITNARRALQTTPFSVHLLGVSVTRMSDATTKAAHARTIGALVDLISLARPIERERARRYFDARCFRCAQVPSPSLLRMLVEVDAIVCKVAPAPTTDSSFPPPPMLSELLTKTCAPRLCAVTLAPLASVEVRFQITDHVEFPPITTLPLSTA